MQRQIDTQWDAWDRALMAAIAAHNAHGAELDKRYEQRFHAQEKAVELALARVDKEFHEHLRAAREETQAALLAADKAITKSEVATERRFESVNEFRAQLNDQASSFMTRSESLSRHDRTAEQLVELAKRHEADSRLMRERFELELKTLRDRHDTDVATINSRLDRSQGSASGIDKAWGYVIGAVGLAGGIIGIIIATR